MSKKLQQIKEDCENSLKIFAQWVLPERYFGDLHMDMFDFIQYGKNGEDTDSKLVLVPRDHQKSICIAVAAAWFITKDPSVTINYISYNSDLVQKQIAFIKSILTSDRHRTLWPDILNWVKDRGELKHKPKYEWQQEKFKIDHPDAAKSADPTLRAGTVRGTNTGMHSKINIFDDLVTDENWKTEVDKAQTLACYENFSKILSPGGKTYAVGTRYSPDDMYAHIMDEVAVIPSRDEEGNYTETVEQLWSVFEAVVEDSLTRDGTGNFCWPREVQEDGSAYGFDERELAIKKAKLSKNGLSNFFAQYYNDPNDESTNKLKRSGFKYLDPRKLEEEGNTWYYDGKKLSIYAYADLAFTDSTAKQARRRDFTAVAVVGVDHEGFIYVLDLKRFQTDKEQVYFDEIIEMYDYWGFKSITVETNSAGKFIKKYLEDEVRRQGGKLVVEGKPHVSHQGSKEERIEHTLAPRYQSGTIYHRKGGYTKELENELVLSRPAHDDLKDAVAGAVALCVTPLKRGRNVTRGTGKVVELSRFGGRRRSRRA